VYQSNARGVGQIHEALYNYWQRLGPAYYVPDVFGRRIVAAFMQKLKPQSLVEVGCGSGELFSAYKDVPLVLGIDWSSEMLKRSKDRIERHGYKNIRLQRFDVGEPLPKRDELQPEFESSTLLQWPAKFDLALTRTCLMHVDPDRVEGACRNLTLLSRSILAFEFYDPCAGKLEWHNWHHEYPSIFSELGFVLADSYDRPDGIHQTLFHFVPARNMSAEPEVAKK
jgi:SAM-dependent methyltransferase